MRTKNDRGTLHSNVICAYNEPSRCFLTVSAAPFTNSYMLDLYKKFSIWEMNFQQIRSRFSEQQVKEFQNAKQMLKQKASNFRTAGLIFQNWAGLGFQNE